MAINDIVSGTWKDVELLNRLNERLRRPITRRDFLGKGAKGFAALIAANYLVNSSKADEPLLETNGIVYDVDNSMSCEKINQIILNANGGDADPNNPLLRDIIRFQPGTYNLRTLKANQYEYYNFLSNRNYLFNLNGVTIWGMGIEHPSLIRILTGGNLNIAGNSTMGNSITGMGIGSVPFKNIDIRGINFTDVYEYCIAYQNIKHASPLLEAAIKVSFCTADGRDKFVMFEGGRVNENSPYVGVSNSTLTNLNSSGGVIDVPIFYKESPSGSVDSGEWVVLGNDELRDNALINCSSLSKPADFWIYHSPEGIAQKDLLKLTEKDPYLITGETYCDKYGGDCHTFNGENCFRTDGSNDFYDGTQYPIMFGRLHLENGRIIGAHPLIATIQSLEYFVERYLSDPISPNWDQRVDFDNDGIVTLKDFAHLANSWYRKESGLIAKTIPFLDKSIAEKALAGEPDYRRLLEDIKRVA